MPAYISTNNHTENGSFISEAVFTVETLKNQQAQEKQDKAKQLLDTLAPLNKGTYADVSSYMLDGHRLMMLFKNGQHCGLSKAEQFVAYTGYKPYPDSILLRGKDGSHIEVSFKRGTHQGNYNKVEIADIQIETCTTFSHGCVDASLEAMRHWISLLITDDRGQPKAKLNDKIFTAKNGDDYLLTCWFKK